MFINLQKYLSKTPAVLTRYIQSGDMLRSWITKGIHRRKGLSLSVLTASKLKEG